MDNIDEESEKKQEELKKPHITCSQIVIAFFVILFIAFIAVSCHSLSVTNSTSSYEKTFNGLLDKTYDEMTPKEKEVYNDYLDWQLKQYQQD